MGANSERQGRGVGRARDPAEQVAVPATAVLPRGLTEARRAAEVTARRLLRLEQPRDGLSPGRGVDPQPLENRIRLGVKVGLTVAGQLGGTVDGFHDQHTEDGGDPTAALSNRPPMMQNPRTSCLVSFWALA